MVENSFQLNATFRSLADPIRRDILQRLVAYELSVGELAQEYEVSFAAISKHLKVLETAKLIRKRKEGRKYMVTLAPQRLQEADEYLRRYQQMWQSRYDRLDMIAKKEYKDGQN